VEEALALNQYQGSWCGSHKARCLFEESAIDQRVDEIANCLALDEDALADAEITCLQSLDHDFCAQSLEASDHGAVQLSVIGSDD
jgi:hypothetical protein